MDKIAASKTALDLAKQVLAIEAEAIQSLAARLGASFLDAVALLLNCKGRVVVSGISRARLLPPWRAPARRPISCTRPKRAMAISA
jgi:hypothetical protein